MSAKRNLLFTSIISLLASAVALTSFTYAWFMHDQALNNVINLTSGGTEAAIETHVYEYHAATPTNPTEVAYYVDQTHLLNAVTVSATSGLLSVRFSNTVLADYALLDAYSTENGLSATALPTYFVELRVIKTNYYGYLSANLTYLSIPTIASGELDFSSVYPFDYRYLAVKNSATTPMVSAIPSQLTALSATTGNDFFTSAASRTNGIALFDASHLVGAPIGSTTGLAQQCFIQGFSTKVGGVSVFAESILLKISVDPLALVQYIRDNPTVMNSSLRLGIDFKIGLKFSNNPILAS